VGVKLFFFLLKKAFPTVYSVLLPAFKINLVECKWKRLIYALSLSDMQRTCASLLCKQFEQQTVLVFLLLLCYMGIAKHIASNKMLKACQNH